MTYSTNNTLSDDNKYHPNLFERDTVQDNLLHDNRKKPNSELVPQNTLYETVVAPIQKNQSRYVTLFGFSIQNRENIKNKVKSIVNTTHLEEGKNSLDIWCDTIDEYNNLLSLNHTSINGEIIGIFKQNFGICENAKIYKESESFLARVFKYFFNK